MENNEVFDFAGVTLLISSTTLHILADALARDSSATRRLEIAKALEGIANNLATAHDKLVPAIAANKAELLNSRATATALSRQLEHIISG